jgi:hypothetical protein
LLKNKWQGFSLLALGSTEMLDGAVQWLRLWWRRIVFKLLLSQLISLYYLAQCETLSGFRTFAQRPDHNFQKDIPNKTIVTAMTPANDEHMMTR